MRRKGRKIGRAAALSRAAWLREGEVETVVRARRFACTFVLLFLGAAVIVSDASATPVDLADLRSRWIEVRFEVSPEDEPGSLDRRWSAPRRARLEALAGTGRVSIRVPALELEAHLRSTGTDTVAGTFTDFVWTLDPVTGQVHSAGFTGRVQERVRIGPFETRAAVDIRVDMNTEIRAGFVPSVGILGIRTNRFCRPGRRDDRGCVAVQPVRFDPGRGYVNAVGHVRAAHPLAEITAFSPLGEVEFRERGDDGTESARSGPSHGEAVCSAAFDRSCPVDGGDT
ncbi:MAG: hypothetical protein AAGC67_18890 [Myxococcota bacterium]